MTWPPHLPINEWGTNRLVSAYKKFFALAEAFAAMGISENGRVQQQLEQIVGELASRSLPEVLPMYMYFSSVREMAVAKRDFITVSQCDRLQEHYFNHVLLTMPL